MFPPWMKSSPGITVGKWTYGKPYVEDHGMGTGNLVIGSFCAIGRDTWFIRSQHHMDWATTAGVAEFLLPIDKRIAVRSGNDSRGGIVVGNDVWIGCHVIIMAGVKIGDGATIGAGAIVTRDIPAYAVAAGVPAVVKRYRFPPLTVDALLRIKWWDWPDDLIRERIGELHSPDIEVFVRKYDPEAVK